MRTTLTLDDDVASRLERLRARRRGTLKEVVNDALRAGLESLEAPARPRAAHRIKPMSLGGCLVDSLDDVEGVLDRAEGVWRR